LYDAVGSREGLIGQIARGLSGANEVFLIDSFMEFANATNPR
jgi:hypothetical protein